MLTSDLVRVRRKAERLEASYLRGAARTRLEPVARALLAAVHGMVGATRDDVEQALGAVDVPVRDRVVGLGLQKLIDDRCEYDVQTENDPEALREAVFLAAAAARRGEDVKGTFDRAGLLAAVAEARGTTAEIVERGLFADLRGNEILRAVRPFPGAGRRGGEAGALLDRYNVALAQAVLLRARRIVVRLEGAAPTTLRALFRAVRFHGLLHVVRQDGPAAYSLEIDGPMSLFGAAQRYGLRLALLVPHLLEVPAFHLRAEVLWGKQREPFVFDLTPDDPLHGPAGPAGLPEDLEAFCEGFRALGSAWAVGANDRIFALPGGVVTVPDLRFESAATGEEVFLERFGFWSRDAVWKRVEACRRGFPARFILAVPKDLRVSEDVLDDAAAGEILIFRTALSPKLVLERLAREA